MRRRTQNVKGAYRYFRAFLSIKEVCSRALVNFNSFLHKFRHHFRFCRTAQTHWVACRVPLVRPLIVNPCFVFQTLVQGGGPRKTSTSTCVPSFSHKRSQALPFVGPRWELADGVWAIVLEVWRGQGFIVGMANMCRLCFPRLPRVRCATGT